MIEARRQRFEADLTRQQRTWLERTGLRWHEEWPLFAVEKVVSPRQVWVNVMDLPPLDGHRDGIRRLLGEIRRLERRLEADGIVGWIHAIAKGNVRMRRWSEMVGAELYAETPDYWHFWKVADAHALPTTMRALVQRSKGAHHAAC